MAQKNFGIRYIKLWTFEKNTQEKKLQYLNEFLKEIKKKKKRNNGDYDERKKKASPTNRSD